MKKITVVKIALYLLVILVFNICYFCMVEEHTIARWISYVAIHLSYLLLCAATLSYKGSSSRGSVVHVYPKIMVSGGYFIASLLLGTALIIINRWPLLSIIVHGLIIGLYLFSYLILMYAEEHTEANEEHNKQSVYFLKDCASRLKLIMDEAPTLETRRKVEIFYNAIIGASASLLPELKDLEDKIVEKIEPVRNAMEKGSPELDDLVNEAVKLIKERERIISLKR